MMKRLGYKKSPNGCTRCKARRVKCDENKPCAACRRHSVPCSLDISSTSSPVSDNPSLPVRNVTTQKTLEEDAAQSAYSVPPVSQGQAQNSTISTDSSDTHVRSEEIGYFAKFGPHLLAGAVEIWDLELMHHYTHVAYQIAFFTKAHDALQSDIPKEAFTQPHLLHQILAFSGFHLAYLRPDSRSVYQVRASQHQAKAISGIRELLQDSVTPENCHSLYASSVFLIISAFSTLPSVEMNNPRFLPIEGLVDIFNLVAGMSLLLQVSEHELRQGPLKSLFTKEDRPYSTIQSLETLTRQLQVLKDRLDQEASREHSGNRMSVVTKGIVSFIDAVMEIQQRSSLSATAQLKVIFLWPIRLEHDFVELLRQKSPFALVVLAHYCAVLHLAEASCWFLSGWADALIGAISPELEGLDPLFLEWPRHVLSQSRGVFQ